MKQKREKKSQCTKEHKINKVKIFFNRNVMLIVCVLLIMFALSGTAFASSADDLWSTITGEIEKWVGRLGGAIVFVGGIMFALGWKSEDAEQKSRGIQTVMAGGMVVALAAITSQFFT